MRGSERERIERRRHGSGDRSGIGGNSLHVVSLFLHVLKCRMIFSRLKQVWHKRYHKEG